MISKEEREKDKALCAAATPGPWAVDPNAENRTDVVSVSQRCAVCYVPDEESPDGAFIAAARNRLPLYIADAEEMERRIAAVEEMAKDADRRANVWQAETDYVREHAARAMAEGLRTAVARIRGEK